VHVLDLLETYRELTAGLMDIYLSVVSNRLNEIMKVLTIMATIFIPLSFIASLYGMNFSGSRWNMPELTWRFGYPFALFLMAATAGGLLWFFRRRGWLGRGGPPDGARITDREREGD
jgi:magnesium transporter